MNLQARTAALPFFLAVLWPLVAGASAGGNAAFRAILENQAVIGIQCGRILENQKEISALIRRVAEQRKRAVAVLERECKSLGLLRKRGLLSLISAPPVIAVTEGLKPDMEVEPDDLETDEIVDREEPPDTEKEAAEAGKEGEDTVSEVESDFVAAAAEEESVVVDLLENLGPDFDGDGVPDELEDLAGTSKFESSDVPSADGLQMAVEEFDPDELVKASGEAEDLYEDELTEIEDDLESDYEDLNIDVEEYL